MPRQSSKPYIEPMPRTSKRSGHSPRKKKHSHGDHHHQQQIEQGSSRYGGTPANLALVPYGVGPVSPYDGYSQISNPYSGAIGPSYSSGTVAMASRRVEDGWGEQKHRLETRLDYAPAETTIQYQGYQFQAPNMMDFATWASDHTAVRQPGKVTDLAQRLRRNISDFDLYLEDCKWYEQERDPQRWEHKKRLVEHGEFIQRAYETLMAHYRGPFIPPSMCSKAQKVEAERLVEHMLNDHFDHWDGFVWHLNRWLSDYARGPVRHGR
ncbi:hypothetical protein GGR58DRAFT_19277 [Xylaria digitata]|nr:hypothetical protein GGR58DRAFT_19277 [Xylaria digitata]